MKDISPSTHSTSPACSIWYYLVCTGVTELLKATQPGRADSDRHMPSSGRRLLPFVSSLDQSVPFHFVHTGFGGLLSLIVSLQVVVL